MDKLSENLNEVERAALAANEYLDTPLPIINNPQHHRYMAFLDGYLAGYKQAAEDMKKAMNKTLEGK